MAETERKYPKTAVICNRKSVESTENASDSEAEFDSPETIEAIRQVLLRHGVPAVTIEADEDLAENLKQHKIEFAFNLAEGKYGRDREAQVPGILGLLNIPYMGSDATAMGISLDKDLCKRLAASFGIRVPKGVVIRPADAACEKTENLTYPLILKPNAGVPVTGEDGTARYTITAEEFCKDMAAALDLGRIRYLGGCCGTNPDFIRALRTLIA